MDFCNQLGFDALHTNYEIVIKGYSAQTFIVFI